MHDETITLSKALLVGLLDAVLKPGWEDVVRPHNPWGPYGPGGPVMDQAFSDLLRAALNPQPLPPHPDPDPVPWRAALLARTVIDSAVAQYQFAEVVAGTAQAERMTEAIRSRLRAFTDEICGTRPLSWPMPWPWPPTSESGQRRPIDLLVAGAQFHKAANLSNPLQGDFAAAADRLFEAGLKRADNR